MSQDLKRKLQLQRSPRYRWWTLRTSWSNGWKKSRPSRNRTFNPQKNKETSVTKIQVYVKLFIKQRRKYYIDIWYYWYGPRCRGAPMHIYYHTEQFVSNHTRMWLSMDKERLCRIHLHTFQPMGFQTHWFCGQESCLLLGAVGPWNHKRIIVWLGFILGNKNTRTSHIRDWKKWEIQHRHTSS